MSRSHQHAAHPDTRLSRRLASCRTGQRTALIPYLTAGDPAPGETVALMHALVQGGADVIELGVPFSDPMADGPVIQLACERALASGMTLRGVLELVAEFRTRDDATPVVLMGYLNSIEAMGQKHFIERAVDAGVDGVLTVDLPPEEAEEWVPAFRSAGLDNIFLFAPTTTPERMDQALRYGSGYLYYVSLKGVTGAATLDTEDVRRHVEIIRTHTDMPIAVGFGIRDGATAARVAECADGVIVGSALVQHIASQPDARARVDASRAFLQTLRDALDEQSPRQS